MRTYEIMIIFDCDAQEDERQAILDGMEREVGNLSGAITNTDTWGLREFAYKINHKTEGYYIVLEFTAEGDLAELERPMNLSDAVVRQKILLLPDAEVKRRADLRASGAETMFTHHLTEKNEYFEPRNRASEGELENSPSEEIAPETNPVETFDTSENPTVLEDTTDSEELPSFVTSTETNEQT